MERPSLLILNEYCLLEIFKFLELDDSMNLAECCNRLRRVADRAVKIKSRFILRESVFRNGNKYIDRVFTHIGHNVSWLKIDCDGINPRINLKLSKIISDCNNLKIFQIRSWKGHLASGIDSTLHNFDKIELLCLFDCFLEGLIMFLKNFYKLKCLNILFCFNESEELMAVLLNNNPEMESLCCIGKFDESDDFYIFHLLERIPKVKRLGLHIFRTLTTTELNSLLTLNGLTKLLLECRKSFTTINMIDINNILSGLAKKGIMEELKLHDFDIDDNSFDILKSFVRLHLLFIIKDGYIFKVKSSTIWPTNLKRLRLENIKFTYLSFMSTIQQLKSLEYIDIQRCSIAKADVADFKNVEKLSRNILNVTCNRKQRLEVALPRCLFDVDDSKTHLLVDLVDSKPLRILYTAYNCNEFRIYIDFDRLD